MSDSATSTDSDAASTARPLSRALSAAAAAARAELPDAVAVVDARSLSDADFAARFVAPSVYHYRHFGGKIHDGPALRSRFNRPDHLRNVRRW
jgi:hypothetical protein